VGEEVAWSLEYTETFEEKRWFEGKVPLQLKPDSQVHIPFLKLNATM
jgi:hypothetical protein